MRVKGSSASRNKHKKLYSITKGFWGRKKNVYRRAREAYLHALTSAFAGRKNRKRDFRKMWIIRINAAGPRQRHRLQRAHQTASRRPTSPSTARCSPTSR